MERCVGSWIIEGELGRGSFAVVWRARHATTGAPAAVKEINTDKLNKKLQESLASEVAVLSQTKHRNIVGLLDLLKDGSRIYIVLEYCAGGDLGLYIRRYGRVSEATARYFLVQLAEGLKELRRHNVIHVSRLYSHSHIRLCI
ncbi:unc51-like kinase [Monoraphidium neglectum]|uniref:Unc51-like kinase n=1 Tax=Monoraphidium neglectum TaxID=145388 RepID=A0A0D2J8B1_9CHLO|nr:unc51-like kinase [Monoraphidium neglectum]KIY95997.1 unc51-like kinase [Monoraphidium neglectum]|eukprot:XP_013895017.1 unc51-like kinase [Monoraphidium neglectum]